MKALSIIEQSLNYKALMLTAVVVFAGCKQTREEGDSDRSEVYHRYGAEASIPGHSRRRVCDIQVSLRPSLSLSITGRREVQVPECLCYTDKSLNTLAVVSRCVCIGHCDKAWYKGKFILLQ